MLDARAAARLASSARSALDLLPVVRGAGCDGDPLPLDDAGLRRLGIADLVTSAHVAGGRESLRALFVELPDQVDAGRTAGSVASRLDRSAPGALWLLIARGSDIVVGAWSAERSRPRVAALCVSPARVMPSDAEALAELAAADGGPDALVHGRWLEILGRRAIGGRFYRALEAVVRRMADEAGGRTTHADRRSLALLQVTRLLFLSYLETKGWLDGDPRFLSRAFDRTSVGGGAFQRRVLHPLFFGTLNTPVRRRAAAARALGRIPFLNGGLFARSGLERRHPIIFSDDAFGSLFDTVLLRYRFTPREEQDDWAEAAIDPEMLGRAFESLMVADRRRETGAFYTPLPLVSHLVDRALEVALRGAGATALDVTRALAQSEIPAAAAAHLRRRLTTLTVLDPACGSGAFLVHALQRIAGLLVHLGDDRPSGTIRRGVLARSIFGVDVDPTAVWLCELRLWLAVVVEYDGADAMSVPPLPNLDRQIRVGDSLAGELPDVAWRQPGGAAVARLRERYARASGPRKRTLAGSLDAAERKRALARVQRECESACGSRRDLLATMRGRNLFGERTPPAPDEYRQLGELRTRIRTLRAEHRRLRDGGALPFAWSVHAADVLDAGGFDLVVGNPPWVRPHRIPGADRASLRTRYACLGDGGWRYGQQLARAGRGFASQVDLAALFVERGLGLAREGGALAYLVPAKLFRSLAGGGMRRLLATRASLELVEDWSRGSNLFDAAVYPAGIVARVGTDASPRRRVEVAEHRQGTRHRWRMMRRALCSGPFDDDAAPWVLLPPEARAAFDSLRASGPPLAESHFGAPLLGVKTGCNEAFVVRLLGGNGRCAEIAAGDRRGRIEAAVLRPLLRGETLGEAREPGEREHLIWTHDAAGAPLKTLPTLASEWLAAHERRLGARTDLRPRMPWWSLFRTASARHDRARVVWADVSRAPRVRVLAPGDPTVALNSCYVISCAESHDATALAALLQSPPAAAWLAALAEPARGGYRRHLAWTVALLPIPRDWPRARQLLLGLANDPATSRAMAIVAAAYGVSVETLAPLVEWSTG